VAFTCYDQLDALMTGFEYNRATSGLIALDGKGDPARPFGILGRADEPLGVSITAANRSME
jgi:hypothetical protein